jgi:hypothetical protein
MTDGDAIDFNVFRGVREYGGPNAHLFRRNFFLKFELLRNSFYAFEVRAASFDVFLDAIAWLYPMRSFSNSSSIASRTVTCPSIG